MIVLRDADATAEAILYFLTDYLVGRSDDFERKGRLLVAYTGHGRPTRGAEKAAFVLSAADDVHGSANVLPMKVFSDAVQALAGQYFHVLTLVNACYGGAFFGLGSLGGNPDMVSLPGGYAITAGPQEEEVPSLDPKRGSLFFDLIIDGVDRGVADTSYWDFATLVDQQGRTLKEHGLTRAGALTTYLTSAYGAIDRMRLKVDPGFKALVSPWAGPAQDGVERGGFFFLSDAQVGTPIDLVSAYGRRQTFDGRRPASVAESFSVPSGPVSSVPGRPDIKVFKAPEVYPIRGFDLSSADGAIDWQAFAAAEHPRFLYVRAAGWRGPDPSFGDRWANAGRLKVDRGAYLKYDFCTSVSAQLSSAERIVPNDPNSLPIGIELVTPSPDQDRDQGVGQVQCFKASGIEQARKSILSFAEGLAAYYGKLPAIYGNRYNLSVLTDARFERYMLWLGAYGVSSRSLQGGNPWTLWQYSGTLNVKGVGPRTTGEAFFGDERQYAQFKEGLVNVALRAAVQ